MKIWSLCFVRRMVALTTKLMKNIFPRKGAKAQRKTPETRQRFAPLRLCARKFFLLVTLALASTITHAQSASVEYQSYLAHIAAASTSLRLHDTAAAKRWLASAPDKYRDWE